MSELRMNSGGFSGIQGLWACEFRAQGLECEEKGSRSSKHLFISRMSGKSPKYRLLGANQETGLALP